MASVKQSSVIENSGRTTVDGVTFFGNGSDLEAGKRELNIESVIEEHVVLWSCTLVSDNSTIFVERSTWVSDWTLESDLPHLVRAHVE